MEQYAETNATRHLRLISQQKPKVETLEFMLREAVLVHDQPRYTDHNIPGFIIWAEPVEGSFVMKFEQRAAGMFQDPDDVGHDAVYSMEPSAYLIKNNEICRVRVCDVGIATSVEDANSKAYEHAKDLANFHSQTRYLPLIDCTNT